jgi:excisionase family DNA binding protein
MGHKQPVRDVGEPLLLTYKEACAKLGVSMTQLYTLMRNKEIRPLELGPQVRRIPMTELDAYLAKKIVEQWDKTPGETEEGERRG